MTYTNLYYLPHRNHNRYEMSIVCFDELLEIKHLSQYIVLVFLHNSYKVNQKDYYNFNHARQYYLYIKEKGVDFYD